MAYKPLTRHNLLLCTAAYVAEYGEGLSTEEYALIQEFVIYLWVRKNATLPDIPDELKAQMLILEKQMTEKARPRG